MQHREWGELRTVYQQHLKSAGPLRFVTVGGGGLLRVLFICFWNNLPLSTPFICTPQGLNMYSWKMRIHSRVRDESYRSRRALTFPFLLCQLTKILVYSVFFRFSHATENATPLTQAKMDDPWWWRWREGWEMAWSWCWISSRMNTCLCGERPVSSPGGYFMWNTPCPKDCS